MTHQEDSIENFVRENTRMIVKHSVEKPNTGYSGVHKCKDCNKGYDNFQALGGHRASHRIPKPETTTGVDSYSKPKLHQCKICKKGFEIGQSLGGHMLKHWRRKDKVTDHILPTDSSSSCSSSSSTIVSHSNGEVVFKYDLNLTPHENDWIINREQLDQDSSLAT